MPVTVPPFVPATSEAKFTKFVMIVGTAVTFLGSVLVAFQAQFPGEAWVGVALIAMGLLTKVLKVAGYTSARTDLKKTELLVAAQANQNAQITVANPGEAIRFLQELEASKIGTKQ